MPDLWRLSRRRGGSTGSAELASLGCYLPAGWRLASRIALHRELAADRAAAGSAGSGVLTGALLKLARLPDGHGRGQPGTDPRAVLLAFARTGGLAMLRMMGGAPRADGTGGRARASRRRYRPPRTVMPGHGEPAWPGSPYTASELVGFQNGA